MPKAAEQSVTVLDDAQYRAEHAEGLMNDPLLVEAIELIEETYTKEWIGSAYASHEIRERAFLMIHAIRDFRDQLQSVVNNGKLERGLVSKTLGRK